MMSFPTIPPAATATPASRAPSLGRTMLWMNSPKASPPLSPVPTSPAAAVPTCPPRRKSHAPAKSPAVGPISPTTRISPADHGTTTSACSRYSPCPMPRARKPRPTSPGRWRPPHGMPPTRTTRRRSPPTKPLILSGRPPQMPMASPMPHGRRHGTHGTPVARSARNRSSPSPSPIPSPPLIRRVPQSRMNSTAPAPRKPSKSARSGTWRVMTSCCVNPLPRRRILTPSSVTRWVPAGRVTSLSRIGKPSTRLLSPSRTSSPSPRHGSPPRPRSSTPPIPAPTPARPAKPAAPARPSARPSTPGSPPWKSTSSNTASS